MSTPLTDGINALTTYANEVTGASDTTLSDAVRTLASGYGGGVESWKVTTVTAQEELYQNAEPVKEWLESVAPLSSLALFIRKDFVASGTRPTRGNGSLMFAVIENGVATYYVRLYNAVLSGLTNWTSTYYVSVDAGDIYTVLYKE